MPPVCPIYPQAAPARHSFGRNTCRLASPRPPAGKNPGIDDDSLRDRAGFTGTTRDVTAARHFVQTRLTVADLPPETIEVAALLVSELATNAVVHAPGPFSVSLTLDGEALTVEVNDTGAGDVAPVASDEVTGRGLVVLDTLTEDWGVRRHLEGKSVYFRLRT
jgi:anti-sigma regulatory factor (Ser/Thr protein kinase)